MKAYKHIFFDLDRTLWDLERNSRETLAELYEKHKLAEQGVDSFTTFHERYLEINENLWNHYLRGDLAKETLRVKRFHDTLKEYGIKNRHLAGVLADDYISKSPHKTHVLPYTHETLAYLEKKYTLHIITNGFEEVQHIKIEKSGIRNYFKHVVTSEEAGAQKPALEIFEYSLKLAKAVHYESIMIGDTIETDMEGARNSGIDHVYFNPSGKAHGHRFTHEISSLKQLTDIL